MALTEIKTSGIADDAVTTDKLANAINTDIAAKSFRNLVHNGAMIIDQRNCGTAYTGATEYVLDRWRALNGGTDEQPTVNQHPLTSSDTGPWAKGFRQSLHITNGNQTSGAQSGSYISIQTRIEAQDIAQSGWDYTSASSYVTLSFWVKASVAQNYYGYLRTMDGTAQKYPFETGSLSANTWTKITKTIPGHANLQFDFNSESGLQINITPFWGTASTDSGVSVNTWAAYTNSTRLPDNTSTWYTTDNSTFEITGVQLEVGNIATDFEHRSHADELRRCQRYFCKTYVDGVKPGTSTDLGSVWGRNYSDSGKTTNVFSFNFPVQMRSTPTTITAYSVTGTAANCSTGAGNPQDSNTNVSFTACKVNSDKGWGGVTTGQITAGEWVGGHFTVSADI